MNGPSVEQNISNALDVLNASAREVSMRLGHVLNVVRGPRAEKEENAKPSAGGLFTELESLAYNLHRAQEQISELERFIGHGGKSAMPSQPLSASTLGGQVGRSY